ncbi:hypothetical protein K435DRAFT_657852, partial [Dendrothele bispora CBS 962.96]
FLDQEDRIIGAAVKKINNPQYEQDIQQAAQLIDEARRNAKFKASEKRSKRGTDFAGVAYGLSYGKGQKRPLRLGGPRLFLMNRLLSHKCFQNIAHHQSSAYATFSPKNYKYYKEGMHNLTQRLPDLSPNFTRSVFACITVNFGPRTCTQVHTDSKNTAHGMCAVTALGDFNPKVGGHIVLWDLKVVLEFPPGCTVLLPSALIRHSNIPVQPNETRYSVTQYTAGGIWRWLDAGGRTEEGMTAEELAAFKSYKANRRERTLDMFSTLEEVKAALNSKSVEIASL